MFGLLVSCLIPNDSAWIFLVKLLLNNLNLFDDIRTGLWCCIIDNIISGYIDFLIRHIFQMVYQWTSFSEYLFFSFPSGFFTCQLIHYATSTSQLINFIITYHTWFSSLSSLESSDSFPLASKFLGISCLSLDAVNAAYHIQKQPPELFCKKRCS